MILSQALRGAIDIEMAEAVDEILGAADQPLQGFESRAGEWDAMCEPAHAPSPACRRRQMEMTGGPRGLRSLRAPGGGFSRYSDSGLRRQRAGKRTTPSARDGCFGCVTRGLEQRRRDRVMEESLLQIPRQ